MAFYTDQQTLDDLRIFGGISDNAVFQIFNHCTTRGGAVVLKEMFSLPLSDHDAINQRSGIIQFFARHNIGFPLKGSDFDAIEPYLDNADERSRLSTCQQSIGQKIGRMIAADAQVVAIEKGVCSLITLFQDMADFVKLPAIDSAQVYAVECGQIREILAIPDFELVFRQLKNKKPADQVMAKLDTVLRFRYRKEVLRLLRAVSLLDVYTAVAAVSNKRGFVFPVAIQGKGTELMIRGLYHPSLRQAVANDIHITGSNNVIFLTGANMAGKSTFMKSFSLALFLAHMGFPVAATAMRFRVLDGIYTTINLPDNLGMGASHFYAEVLRLKKVAYELSMGKKLFIVFDELFRGTNVKDAYEATIAVTRAFAQRNDSIFVISTHIIEAGEVLKADCPNVGFLQLPTRMEGNKPVYTYRLETGITSDRHGMVIVNNEGILLMLEAGITKTHSTGSTIK